MSSSLIDDDADERDALKGPWEIRREGRSWTRDEMMHRFEWTPEKFEVVGGRMFWSETDRLAMLAMLLENVGLDKAVQLGDPTAWREAVARLP